MRIYRCLAGAMLLVAMLVGANVAKAGIEGYVWMHYLSHDGDNSVTITKNDGGAKQGLERSGLGFGEFYFDVTGFAGSSTGSPSTDLEIDLSTAINWAHPDAPGEMNLSGYCIDSGQFLDGGVNQYEIRPLVDMFAGTDRSDDLRKLYGAHLASVDSTLKRAAFAAAAWEIVYEDTVGAYSLTTGDFQMANETWTATAQGYLGTLGSTLNDEVYALYDSQHQDFSIVIPGTITVIPEPFTMATAFLAISSFGMYIRKHTRKGKRT